MPKSTYIQLRATETDKEKAKALAEVYGVGVSELFLLALNYIDQERPPLSITIRPSIKPKPRRGG